MSKIQLGDRVRYRVNGFTGIVTSTSEDLQQCRQVFIQPEKLDRDGLVQVGHWYDEPWCDVIKAGVLKPKAAVEEIVAGKRVPVSGAVRERSHPPARHS